MIEQNLFWNNVNKSGPILIPELGECWVWTANTRTGYGVMTVTREGKRTTISAHRLSWAWDNELDYPDRNIIVRHQCDNPPCVRPTHLLSGSYWDNNHDTMQRERMSHTKLTNDLVRQARTRARTGESLHDIIKDMPEGTSVAILAAAVRGVTYPYADAEPVLNPSFFRQRYQKLSDQEYQEIYAALQKPWRGQGNFLARKYGVDKSLISLIKSGKFRPASLRDGYST